MPTVSDSTIASIANKLNLSGGTTTGAVLGYTATPTNTAEFTPKIYVDSLMGASPARQSCRVATTGPLNTYNYDNGSSGVGATLTKVVSFSAVAFDGVPLSVGDRVLVWQEANQARNGIYYVSQVGNIASPSILTRAQDYDSSTEVFAATFTLIQQGNTHAGKMFVQLTAGTISVGVSNLSFAVYPSFSFLTAGTGISLNTNTISIANTAVTAGNYGANTKSLTINVNAQGQITSISASDIAIPSTQITDFATQMAAKVSTSGSTLSGPILNYTTTPTNNLELAPKAYVDAVAGGGGGGGANLTLSNLTNYQTARINMGLNRQAATLTFTQTTGSFPLPVPSWMGVSFAVNNTRAAFPVMNASNSPTGGDLIVIKNTGTYPGTVTDSSDNTLFISFPNTTSLVTKTNSTGAMDYVSILNTNIDNIQVSLSASGAISANTTGFIRKIGERIVEMFIDRCVATSTATSLITLSGIPSDFLPTNECADQIMVLVNGIYEAGICVISTSGTITVYAGDQSVPGNTFPSGFANTGIGACKIQWRM